jgi:hypothetical protein
VAGKGDVHEGNPARHRNHDDGQEVSILVRVMAAWASLPIEILQLHPNHRNRGKRASDVMSNVFDLQTSLGSSFPSAACGTTGSFLFLATLFALLGLDVDLSLGESSKVGVG